VFLVVTAALSLPDPSRHSRRVSWASQSKDIRALSDNLRSDLCRAITKWARCRFVKEPATGQQHAGDVIREDISKAGRGGRGSRKDIISGGRSARADDAGSRLQGAVTDNPELPLGIIQRSQWKDAASRAADQGLSTTGGII